MIRELTGEFIHFIECDNIQSDNRYFYDEIVFFGDEADLEAGGIGDNIETLSMIDRYSFAEQRIQFYYNDDPACREKNQLDPEKKFIVSFNGHNSVPSAWEYTTNDPIDMEQLIFMATVGVVKGTPKWG